MNILTAIIGKEVTGVSDFGLLDFSAEVEQCKGCQAEVLVQNRPTELLCLFYSFSSAASSELPDMAFTCLCHFNSRTSTQNFNFRPVVLSDLDECKNLILTAVLLRQIFSQYHRF
jgi:hypothetical protein